jgi:hypothetical protein
MIENHHVVMSAWDNLALADLCGKPKNKKNYRRL